MAFKGMTSISAVYPWGFLGNSIAKRSWAAFYIFIYIYRENIIYKYVFIYIIYYLYINTLFIYYKFICIYIYLCLKLENGLEGS